jgi:hypothetical protein
VPFYVAGWVRKPRRAQRPVQFVRSWSERRLIGSFPLVMTVSCPRLALWARPSPLPRLPLNPTEGLTAMSDTVKPNTPTQPSAVHA